MVARDSEVTFIDGTWDVDRSRRSELAEAEVERRFLNLLNSRLVRTLLGRTENIDRKLDYYGLILAINVNSSLFCRKIAKYYCCFELEWTWTDAISVD